MSPPPRNDVSNNWSKICGQRAFATRNRHGRPRTCIPKSIWWPSEQTFCWGRVNAMFFRWRRFCFSSPSLLPPTPLTACPLLSPPTQRSRRGNEERRLLRFIQSPSFVRPSIHPEFRKMTDFTLCLAFVRLNSSLVSAKLRYAHISSTHCIAARSSLFPFRASSD